MPHACPIRSRRAPLLLLALLAACGDGGEAGSEARLHQLRLDIVSGKGIRDTVRAPGDPADARTALPVVVRVVADADYSVGAFPAGTGPALELRIPPVEIRWRTLQPWCRADREVTSLAGADTASAFVRLPTVADACHVVVEGVLNGDVFDADTAVAKFDPGPLATFELPPVITFLPPARIPVRAIDLTPRDRYGNLVQEPDVVAELVEGQPVITLRNDTLTATAQGVGRLKVTGAGSTQYATVWTLRDLRGTWRLTWTCYGARLDDGSWADSARFVLPATATYGSFDIRGAAIGFVGPLTTRTWVQGQPVRETVLPFAPLYAWQRPNQLQWTTGHTAAAAGRNYVGGSLCDLLGAGGPWQGFAPARAEQLE